jgi:hypothetical protein
MGSTQHTDVSSLAVVLPGRIDRNAIRIEFSPGSEKNTGGL